MPADRTLLIQDADLIVTQDDARRELPGASLLVRGPQIEAIWPAGQRPPGLSADEVIDARSHALLPGLVSTHHHMFQSLTRVVPAAQDAELFGWLRTLYPNSAALARALGTRLHTHLAENDHDIAYSRARFNMTPTEYADSVGWLGSDVWHAHCVKLDAAGIARFAATGTGVAHCPCSNMRLASGIAPVRRLLDAGVPVALGVDGSASNDGARVLGRHDIGDLAPGMAADLALFDLRSVGLAGGAVHDPLAALLMCAPASAAYTVVNGRVLVRQGQLTTLDLGPLVESHNRLLRQLVNRG